MNATEWLTRVRRMEGGEIRFRARVAARARADLLASAVRTESWQRERLAGRLADSAGLLATACERLEAHDWQGAHLALSRHFHARQSRFPLSPGLIPALAGSIGRRFPDAVADARTRGNRLISGRFDLLGYQDLAFASEVRGRHSIDWHFDPVHHRRAASGFWTKVRYLDPQNGDHKIIWELNRHQHWLALGRAAWLTGDRAYRDEFVRQLEDWLCQNPPLVGINWASPLELSFRCLSWLWALHLFVEFPGGGEDHPGAPWVVDLLLGLDRQLAQVEANLSRYFSPNTHLTGEALGLYVCGCALPELRGASSWVQAGREVLLEQIDRQILPDGGHVERSAHYHRYTLDFYLLALVVARLVGDPAADRFRDAVRRLAGTARMLADDEGRLPLVGDDDGGMLFPMCGRKPADARDSLATAAALLEEPALAVDGTLPEETWWLTGRDQVVREWSGRGGGRPSPQGPGSAALPDTGYYVSRRRAGDHVMVDGGPHGYLNGGHAHADALAVTLTLSGRQLFIDPGTATYTMSAGVRDRFRTTAMHNALTVDGRSQSVPNGPFHWKTAASATVHRWLAAEPFDYFEGTHDGYLPLLHRRRVAVLAGGVIVIVDSVAGEGVHELAAHWHAAPGWSLEARAPGSLSLRPPPPAETGPGPVSAQKTGPGPVLAAWVATSAARLELFDGDDDPGLGWSSPAYGQVVQSLTLRASVCRALPASIITAVGDGSTGDPLTLKVLEVETEPGTDAAACRLTGQDASYLLIFCGGDSNDRREARTDGFLTDARLTLIEEDGGGQMRRVALLDGSRVTDLRSGRDLVRLASPVDGVHVQHESGEDLAMCGIAGFVDRERASRQAREPLLRAMCAAIRHRGPDDEGVYLDETAALGMRRLSIIDLSTGHQPISNEDGTVWVVFNGEIYNYREVAAELRTHGHHFRTSSDTEVIVHAWEQWGEAALSRLRGMFGLAVWNATSRTLWLARDRPGIKPLHYAVAGSRLVFGSEIKSLLVDRSIDRALDPQALDHYCSFLYTPGDRSIFSGIRKLPPAHVLRWTDGVVRVWPYWHPPHDESFDGTERDAADELRARLADAVKAHMISDVPLGAFLSGGVDSSAVVGLMAEASSRPVRTFSIGFEEASFNELDHARAVAERFGTDHHEFVVKPDAVGLVDRLVAHFDEPFADSSALPTWYVSEMAARHVKVVLSGDGGDELFGGYERYVPHPRVAAFDRLAGPAARPLAAAAWPHWPKGWRGRNFLRHVALGREERYVDDLAFFGRDEKASLYSPDLWSRLGEGDAETSALERFEDLRHLPWASQMMRLDFLTYLPEDVLTKVDCMSMAHSIESRVPLLDTGVVEFAATLPAGMKIRGERLKHVFKEALTGLLPPEVLDRPKHGFGVPLGTWFGGRLRDLFGDTLLSARARSRGLFRQQAVDRLLHEHLSGRRDHTLRIWLLVVLELWHRQYVDDAAAATAA